MNDNWIKAFQDKLGDYQLDLPAAAPHRRKGFIWMTPAAAAAALLAFLLLRKPEAGNPFGPARLIAEVPATVAMTRPDPATALRLVRRNRPDVRDGQVSLPVSVVSDEPMSLTETPEEPLSQEPERTKVEETPVTRAEETIPRTANENPEPEEESPRQRSSISGRLHINPMGLSGGTASFFSESVPSYQDPFIRDMKGMIGVDNAMFMANASNNYNMGQTAVGDRPDESIRCDLPVKTGLAVRIDGPGRFSVESGLNYSFHRVRVAYQESFPEYKLEYRMHYLGIPLKGIVSLAEWKALNLYATAGGELEWMLTGKMRAQAGNQQVTTQAIKEHPTLFSLTGSAGIEYVFSPRLGLYAEPGIAWHAKPKGTLPNYYREHPCSFDLHVGLRFNLN